MAFKGRQFDSLQELLDYLNGVVLGRELSPTLDLDGLTFIVNDGTDKTVTFVGNGLTPNVVIAQINAVKAGAVTLRNYGQTAPPQSRLAFILAALKIKSTGTANALLGMPTSGGDVTIGAGAIALADIVAIDEWTGRYTVVHQ